MSKDLQTILAEVLLRQTQLEQQNRDLMTELQTIKSELRGKIVAAGEGWLDTRPAATALQNVGVRSVKQLRELLYRGVFSIESGEIRNTGSNKKPNWQFNIPKCQKAVNYFYSLPEYQRDVEFPRKVA